jgi:sterol desaturase/sphingolipid hydroxylase (fatty acid hydroxylase superfamily)
MLLMEQLLLLITTPLYMVVIGLEMILSHVQVRKYYSWKETLTNVYLCCINGGIDLLFRGVYVVVLVTFYEMRFLEFSNNLVLYWGLLFILEDLTFYLEHRVDHYCRLFWAVHVTHHSSEEFNLTTGFRSSVLQPLYRFIYFIPLALLGFQPIDIVFMYSLTQIYGILVHTQYVKKMPRWFEAVFVSPSHHRVHHASNIRYLDKNMGMVLIIWDRLFGTFQKELPTDPVKFGLVKPLENPNHPIKIIVHEWQDLGKDLRKKMPWRLRLKYLFMPPGWSHDGSTKTAKQLRAELAEAEKSQQICVPTTELKPSKAVVGLNLEPAKG